MEQKAIYALGCFWGVENHFMSIPGVLFTRVGYAGGVKENPNYSNLGDHSESIEITFDPKIISYQELLNIFWEIHDPTINQKNQYASRILTLNREQYDLAQISLEEEQKKYKIPILTIIKPASNFWQAEEYHQKYIAKQKARLG
jgi:peptide-methionine (S)-S-oxide reductase